MNKLMMMISAVAMIWSSCAIGESNLSSIPIVSGTLTVDAPGEYVVDTDISCTLLEVTAQGPVTFLNPGDDTTNTIHAASITSGVNATPVFRCKVEFTSSYDVTAESPVNFAGGATATAPGTTSGTCGNVLKGDITFTANWVLPASATYTIAAGARLVGKDVSGGNASSIVVEDGASAKFASATLATRGLRMTVFGELDIEGWLTCYAATDVYARFPSETLSTGTIRVGGVKGTGDKLVQAFNVNDIYIGANGLYGMNTAHPDWFWLDTSSVVYHAMEDFTLSGSVANSSFLVCSPITFNTHGHTVIWMAKIGRSGSGSITKDGEGVLVLQPPAVFPANQSASVSALPLEVKSGVLRMGTAIVAGPVLVRGGATFEVAGGVTAANAVTLDSGAKMSFGPGASIGGSVAWPDGIVSICVKETGTLIASGVTEAALEKIALSPDSVDGTFSVSDGALVFTKRDPVIYVWQGGVDGRFSTLGNWLVGGEAAASLPHAQDIALFENTAAATVVLDSDGFVGELRFLGTSPVTLGNPSATETNTVRVGSIISGADANPVFNCKVAFDSAYSVTAESPVVFAGGVTTPALGTVAGEYGGILSGDITITANCVLPASAVYTVAAGRRLVGKDVSGGNASSIVVEEGASAKFASATLATRGLRMTVFGELDIEGWLTCYATTDTYAKYPSETLSTGTIRVGGVKGTGDKVVQAFNVNDIYIGANGLYGMNTAHPDWFWLDTSSVVYHAMEDFTLSGSPANSSFLVKSPITFNTHGYTVTWTAKIGGDGNGSITKDGEGVLVLQPPAVFPAIKATPVVVKAGVLRMGTSIVTGPIAVRDGATLEVADGVSIANAVTLDAGATLELGEGALVAGSISTPVTGTATVKPHGDFSGLTGWTASATLGVLAAGAEVSALSLDTTAMRFPTRGWHAQLKRSNDSLDIVFSKSGMMVIVK